jgi:hypothetical protein
MEYTDDFRTTRFSNEGTGVVLCIACMHDNGFPHFGG